MAEILAIAFIIAWFIFWGWMLVHRPDTVMAVWGKSNEQMGKAAKGATKAALFGAKFLKK